MSATNTGRKETLEIRKYRNRRFYDSTHGRHLTLEDIRALVKEGHNVRVTDGRTSADITGQILTQIILDLDAPKLELFPAAFLAEVIRVNDHLLEGYFEKFLSEATRVFIEYQKLMEVQVKEGAAQAGIFPPLGSWSPAMLNPFVFGHHAPGAAQPFPAAGSHPEPPATSLADLRRQMDEIQARLAEPAKPGAGHTRIRRARARGPRRTVKKPSKK
jgi:polyhydroxyalkanoate synthesis repressor PhaR